MLAVYFHVALGAVIAGFVQGLSGFAFSMVAVSIWAWTIEPQLAAYLAIVGALTGQIWAAVMNRRGLYWGILWPFLAGALAGIPLGVWLLPRMDVAQFKLVIGLMLVIVCPLMLAAPHLPPVRQGGRVGDVASGIIGGVMGAFGGFAGVVPTLWSSLRGFTRDEHRATIQNFSLVTLSVALATHLWQGHITAAMLPFFGVVAVAVLVPVWLGSRLYLGLSDRAFRRLVLSILTCSGAAMIASVLGERWGLFGY